MRILLLGEYSRLHNSLKEGLLRLGHEVVLVGNGDGFKNYPVDFSLRAKWSESVLGRFPRQVIYKIFGFDIAKWEHGIRFYALLPKLKNFDVVQLINECPIQTTKAFELYLLKQLLPQNKSTYLLSSGVDYLSVQYLLHQQVKKNILQPYLENPTLKKEYDYVLDYTTPGHKKIHDYLFEHCKGVIATDMDYVLPLQGHAKFLGLIPNPINTEDLDYIPLEGTTPLTVFLGINQWNTLQKGIFYFEQALAQVKEKYQDALEVIVVQNIPYQEYIALYDKAHIVLDQVFAYDQGYNALEAMAKGKVVFTGAEKEFLINYGLQEDEVAINALPDVGYLVEKLSHLIEHPDEISAISKRARAFIEKEHDLIAVTQQYIKKWE